MPDHLFTPGDSAPDFAVNDVYGKQVSLTSQSKDYVLLAFLRYASCPFCNLTIHRLALEYAMLTKNNCNVVAFIQSDIASIITNIYGRHAVRPPFPIIADPKKQIFNRYGVHSSIRMTVKSVTKIPFWVHAVRNHGFKQSKINGDFFLVPALFLVNTKTKQFIRVEYGTSLYDHDTFTHIYEPLVFNDEA